MSVEKKSIKKIFSLVLLLSAIALALPLWAQKDISNLAGGVPTHVQEQRFPMEQYAEFTVEKLANPKLLWVNIPLLKEMGYQVGDSVDAALEKSLLDRLAWVSKDTHVQPGDVTGEQRKMYSDFYGGTGIGWNLGSARAASSGEIQAKGVGITPLLKHYDAKHTARSTVHEAIKDAVWGEVLNNELPFGANRIVAIIDRGGSLENGEPQILEIRQDPVRAGHFNTRTYGSDTKDQERNNKSGQFLLRNLPQDPSNLNPTIESGLLEYSKRIGTQYGRMFMMKLFHGATSESNIEISGRMIDFGTASSLPTYARAQFLAQVDPFGPTKEIRDILLSEFKRHLAMTDKLAAGIVQNMFAEFDKAYETERRTLALQKLGVPRTVAESMLPSHRNLAKRLISMAELNLQNGEVINLQEQPNLKKTKLANADQLIENLAKNFKVSNLSIDEVIKISLQALDIRGNEYSQLSAELREFFEGAKTKALAFGIPQNNFTKWLSASMEFFNRPLEELYLPELRKKTESVTKEYLAKKLSTLEKTIREVSENSFRSFEGLPSHQVPVAFKNGKLAVYDARLDKIFHTHYQAKDRSMEVAKRKKSVEINVCSKVFLAI